MGIGTAMVVPGSMFLSSPASASAPMPPLPSLDSLLDARSPGMRRYGWLSDSKSPRYAAATPDLPTERVLSSVRRRPILPVEPGEPALLDEPIDGVVAPGTDVFGPAAALGDSVPGFVSAANPPESGGFFPVPTGPDGSGGSGPNNPGGSGPDNPGGGTVVPPGTVVPSVPEPATWAMLIAGFGMLGTIMRKRRGDFLSLEPA